MRIYMLRRYHERRKWATKRLGGKCLRCGAKNNLEFDHINPDSKIFVIARLNTVSYDKFVQEVEKCQLLCRVCHTNKTLKELNRVSARGTHGTLSSYKYCHCRVCKDVHNAYCKKWKRKNRAIKKTSNIVGVAPE